MSVINANSAVKVNRPSTILLSNGKRVNADLTCLSEKGLGILYGAPAEVGKTLGVKFTLNIDNHIRSFNLKCKVARNHLRNNMYHISMHFVAIEANDLNLIVNYVNEKRSHQVLEKVSG